MQPGDLVPKGPFTGRGVVCLHGFLRTGASMLPMAYALRKAGYTQTWQPTWGYHLRDLKDNARRMLHIMDDWADQVGGELDIVSHSFGGILTRCLLGHAPIRRVVMLAPPNQGAHLAGLVRDTVPVHRFGWDPLAQVIPGATSELPHGGAEIGIITGGTGTEAGFNPLIPGDNDQTVAVEEARLEGVDEFVVLPVRHTFIMANADVQALVLRFMETGSFVDPLSVEGGE